MSVAILKSKQKNSVKTSLTLAEQVLTKIQTAIIKGEIPNGSKINEQELAATYGISRGPLREAISRLESQKLIERIPHVGARVVSLDINELSDLFKVREVLEGMAAQLAAENMTDDEIKELENLLLSHEQSEQLQQGDSYYQQQGDLDFHYLIITGSKNRTLINTLTIDLYHIIRMYRFQCSAETTRPQKAFKEHRRIVEAIAARDGELAQLLMKRHISAARKNTEQRLSLIAANN
ncbi:MAG: GntR family transcriptional regulator [Gammaproteobacteria bacterium]|nr:GntR family transcriptional regulator [Gammaproteobacteria bacterium]